jgi:hypothetical protein
VVNVGGKQIMVLEVNHEAMAMLFNQGFRDHKSLRKAFHKSQNKQRDSVFKSVVLKDIKQNTYCELTKSKFLIYSFTHDSFCLVNVASSKCEVAAVTLQGLEENTVQDICFSDPPTHLFYTTKLNEVKALPVKIILNQKQSHSDSLAFYDPQRNPLSVGRLASRMPKLPEHQSASYF